jgi:hypothetical protein
VRTTGVLAQPGASFAKRSSGHAYAQFARAEFLGAGAGRGHIPRIVADWMTVVVPARRDDPTVGDARLANGALASTVMDSHCPDPIDYNAAS